MLEAISPTPTQWFTICALMVDYVGRGTEINELAADIDQMIYPTEHWTRNLAAKGLRRYTEWRKHVLRHSDVISPQRRQMVKDFVSQL